jgi:hypothetical protein
MITGPLLGLLLEIQVLVERFRQLVALSDAALDVLTIWTFALCTSRQESRTITRTSAKLVTRGFATTGTAVLWKRRSITRLM